MKTNVLLFLFAVAVCVFAGVTSYAQSADASRIKILPSASRDILKVLFAAPVDAPVKVTFYRGTEILGEDLVTDESHVTGFLKKYDVSRIKESTFWVEVASGRVVVTYKVNRARGGRGFVSVLERTKTDSQLLAKKK